MSFDALLDLLALEPEREGDAAAVEAEMPVAGSTVKDRIFSGVFAATSSMSMPPSVEPTKAMRLDCGRRAARGRARGRSSEPSSM